MSALAGLLKDRGYRVAGSDVAAYPPVGDLLKSLQIPVHLGYEVDHLKSFGPDYVVIGNFVRRDNPQAQYVLESKIPYGSFPSTLEDFFLQDTQNYVVVGTHGKTTTTSCLAHLLAASGQDPSFLVGGVPVNFGKSFHVGRGKAFVIEGDEYDTAFFDKESKFLHYRPTVGIFNSVEYDHADIFPTVESMENMFRKFLGRVAPDGELFYCSDWDRVVGLVAEERKSGVLKAKAVSFGFSASADFRIENFEESEGGIRFRLAGMNFESSMSGRFNAQNFSGAILAARRAGVPLDAIQRSLKSFEGVKRRQEVFGRVGEHLVIDDFAHHPTAVRRVLEGLRAKYPHHRLLTFFEPRSNTSRRNILQKEFETCFEQSDLTLMAELFKKESIPEAERLDLKRIEARHRELGRELKAGLTIPEMLERAKEFSKKGPSVFLVLSNGAFEGLHQKLISELSSN